jgi:hypothetical protein
MPIIMEKKSREIQVVKLIIQRAFYMLYGDLSIRPS